MTMTMKPKYFLALGLLALGLGSCGESFFEQYPSNNITEGNFYNCLLYTSDAADE